MDKIYPLKVKNERDRTLAQNPELADLKRCAVCRRRWREALSDALFCSIAFSRRIRIDSDNFQKILEILQTFLFFTDIFFAKLVDFRRQFAVLDVYSDRSKKVFILNYLSSV